MISPLYNQLTRWFNVPPELPNPKAEQNPTPKPSEQAHNGHAGAQVDAISALTSQILKLDAKSCRTTNQSFQEGNLTGIDSLRLYSNRLSS